MHFLVYNAECMCLCLFWTQVQVRRRTFHKRRVAIRGFSCILQAFGRVIIIVHFFRVYECPFCVRVLSAKIINDLYSKGRKGKRSATLARLTEVCNEKKDRAE